MPKGKSARKLKKASNAPDSSQLDIIFAGPMLFVPGVINGNISSIAVYSPRNGHPIGAVFVPSVFFTDEELNQPEADKWPRPDSFSLLDPHSYAIDLAQTGEHVPFPVASIPEDNHKVRPGRESRGDWEVAIRIHGKLSAWASHRHLDVSEGMYLGSDAPRTSKVAGMHRLTYLSVTSAEFCGLEAAPKAYLAANLSKGGSLIVIGEIPYQSTLRHERQAIDALALLAGLDLHLSATAPITRRTRLMNHVQSCGHTVITV